MWGCLHGALSGNFPAIVLVTFPTLSSRTSFVNSKGGKFSLCPATWAAPRHPGRDTTRAVSARSWGWG